MIRSKGDAVIIGGAFWTPEATVVGGTRPSFETVMKKLFENSEQGFWYDPNDLSTMFQDAAGTVPVTAVGQPVGLLLDKNKGLELGVEKVVNSDFDSNTAWIKAASVTISNGSAIFNGATGNPVLSQNVGITAGKWYELTINVTEVTSGLIALRIYGISGNDVILTASSVGVHKARVMARSDAIGLIGFSGSSTSMKISSVSVKEILGITASQTISAARPILQSNPRRIDFDAVDDKLITKLPAQLSGCTVIRSVPSVGTQILTNQTIPATYEDNTDHCGLIVINRALTPSETSAITSEFNKMAGV